MAKEKSDLSKEERRALKKSKKEDSLGASDTTAGISKPKSDKKKTKEEKAKRTALAERALNEVESRSTSQMNVDNDEDDDEGEAEDADVMEVDKAKAKEEDGSKDSKQHRRLTALMNRPVGALVPFANPLVTEEKNVKKIFKSVKKAASHRSLKRGVKEVVKAVRRSPTTATGSSNPIGVVVLAADISPMDVISHIPVLCEDHHIPYVYVKSRAELGMAGQTKRPTSVVMVNRDLATGGKKRKRDGEGEAEEGPDAEEEWKEIYKGLVKVAEKEGRVVKK